MNTKFLNLIKTIITVGVLTVGATYIYADWVGPPAGTPPTCSTQLGDPNFREGCNVPVNEGPTAQVKRAGLGLWGRFYTKDKASIGLDDPTTMNPDLKLQVNGKVGATAYCDQNGQNCLGAGGAGGGFWAQIGTSNRIENTNEGRVEINSRVKIGGGNPGVDKVLASTDDTGIAKWKTLADLGAIEGFTASCGAGKAINSINVTNGTVTCVTVPNSSGGGGGILQLFFGGGSGGGPSGACYQSTGSCRTGYYRSATIPGQQYCRNVTYQGPPNCAIGSTCTKQVCTTDDTTYQCCPR